MSEKAGLGQTLNALFPPTGLQRLFDAYATPTVSLEEEMRRLVRAHGPEAVRKATKAATARKRGRRADKDWELLRPFVSQDAADWLAGVDPFSVRTSYSIAQQIAETHRGHSRQATFQRVYRKLRKRRRSFVYATALATSESEFPFELHFRALRELAQADPEHNEVWHRILEQKLAALTQYREVHGEPEVATSWKELMSLPRYPANSLGRLLSSPRVGMFGNLAK